MLANAGLLRLTKNNSVSSPTRSPLTAMVIVPLVWPAGIVSVPVAATFFTVLFAVGGNAPVATDRVLVAMLSWHAVIGIGEAVITGLVVASVVGVRPDLVYGARSALRARPLEIRQPSPAGESS